MRLRGLAGHCFVLVLSVALIGAARPSHAQPPERSIAQYRHSHWTSEDGAPSNIAAIAQSADGFLWLGTSDGLYRFDGIRFQRIKPIPGDRTRSPQVSALAVTRSGDLWVGHRWGGIAIYRGGQLHPVSMPRPAESVVAIAEDQAGDIWTVSGRSRGPVSRYRHGRWESVGKAEGVPDQVVGALLAPRDGSVWIAGWDGVSVRPSGHTRFEPVAGTADDENKTLSVGRMGEVWMLGLDGPRRLWVNGALTPFQTPAPGRLRVRTHQTPRLLFDRQGAMWATDQESGLMRLAAAALADRNADSGQLQLFGRADGLSSDGVTALFEGREGEIWVGTTAGLDRFRPADVVPAPTLSPPGGGLLFADRHGGLYLIDSSTVSRVAGDDRVELLTDSLNDVGAICDAPDGSLWLASAPGLIHLTGKRSIVTPLPYDPTLSSVACVVEPGGRLWLSAGPEGLFRRDGDRWTPVPVGSSDAHVRGLRLDPAGRLLAVVRNKGLYRIADGRAKLVWSGDQIGRIVALGPYEDAMLIAGIYGVGQLHGDRLQVLASDRYPWLANIRGLAQTATDAWFLTDRGLIRVTLGDLRRAFRDQGPLPHELFDADDGLISAVQFGANRPITTSRDGRIWITTPDGAFWIDPARRIHNTLPPPVVITALTADGRPHPPGARLRLEKGVSRIQIDYTALSLLIPDRVRFRYRLEGEDADWVDPGSRRQAFYTNLKPGPYRFQVIAANDDGVWNRVGASQDFTIPPTFLQSTWFKLLCLGVLALAAWLAYQLRVRFLTERLENRLEARISERERIARELHDTLLQGIQGLMLRLQAVAEKFPVGQEERTLIEDALDRADAVMIEGRDSVHALRASPGPGDLTRMLSAAADDLRCEGSPAFQLVIEGEPRDLDGMAAEEMGRIGQEAIRNAFRHSGAKTVVAEIRYGRRAIVLRIRDDGVGIQIADGDPAKASRFGLLGLRERAERLGARLTISSGPHSGTDIVLTLRRGLAYKSSARQAWLPLTQ